MSASLCFGKGPLPLNPLNYTRPSARGLAGWVFCGHTAPSGVTHAPAHRNPASPYEKRGGHQSVPTSSGEKCRGLGLLVILSPCFFGLFLQILKHLRNLVFAEVGLEDLGECVAHGFAYRVP